MLHCTIKLWRAFSSAAAGGPAIEKRSAYMNAFEARGEATVLAAEGQRQIALALAAWTKTTVRKMLGRLAPQQIATTTASRD